MSAAEKPRIVTPQEAQRIARILARAFSKTGMARCDRERSDLAHTVATEPDRTRAAVVKALRWAQQHADCEAVKMRADDIERGAEL